MKTYNQTLKTPFVLSLSFIFAIFISCGKDDDAAPLSSEKEIVSFTILDDISGTIDHSAQAVTVTTPIGTDISSIAPVLSLSENATYTPTGEQDFSSPVVYTLTAEDGSQIQYTVTVTVALNNAAQILNFAFLAENNPTLEEDVTFAIDEETKTITAEVPYGTDVTALTPTVEASADASFAPEGAQDFSSEVTYTVTAEDGTETTYNIILNEGDMAPREALIAIYNANPGNTLGWDLEDPDISNWDGITIDENGDVTEITFYEDKITILPAEIGQLVNLKKLTLNGNKITSLPSEIGQLVNLTWLDLGDNEFTIFPLEVVQLVNLTVLGLQVNKLTSIPAEIGKLINLTELTLTENKLTNIPSEIGQLHNLIYLRLEKNQLTVFPEEITQLTKLEGLYAYRNQLVSIPLEISNLVNLETLGLNYNQLTEIPVEIGQMSSLSLIVLDNNQLISIPSEISQLSNLKNLYASHNQLTSIPQKVCEMKENYGTKINLDVGVVCE